MVLELVLALPLNQLRLALVGIEAPMESHLLRHKVLDAAAWEDGRLVWCLPDSFCAMPSTEALPDSEDTSMPTTGEQVPAGSRPSGSEGPWMQKSLSFSFGGAFPRLLPVGLPFARNTLALHPPPG